MAVSDRLGCGCPRAGRVTRTAGGYVVSRCAYVPTCRLGFHAHPEDRVVLVARGEFDSVYGSRTFAIDARSAIYRPALVEHWDRYPREAACISILLTASAGARAPAFNFADDDLPGAARRLWAELGTRDSAAELAIESLSAEIVGRVSPMGPRERGTPHWIRSVRDRLEDEYSAPPALSAIARDVDREVTHLVKTFRKAYGTTPGEYVRDVRIWRARGLLDDASIPLAEVAARGGFADQSHFTRLFRRRFSMTPGEYRRRARVLHGSP